MTETVWQFDYQMCIRSLYAPDSSFDFSAMTHISPKQVKKYLRSDGTITFHQHNAGIASLGNLCVPHQWMIGIIA